MQVSSFANNLLENKWIKGLRAVGYGRVSTDSEDQQNSLENQIRFFADYFQEQGFQMVKECGALHKRDGSSQVLQGVYADEGITATKNKGRRALQQLIHDAQERKFDVIFTKNIQRFGRNVEESINVYKSLKELGIAFYFLDVQLSSLDGDREFILNLFLANAQEESRSKSKAVQWGIHREQLDGNWTGMPMFGYDKEDGKLVKNEEEGKYVVELFNKFYNEGFGMRKLSNYLYDEEVYTKRGNRRWDSGSVTHFLTNPIYCGLQVQHTMQTTDINRDIIETIDEDEWVITYRPELAYIDFDLYNRIQLERTNRHPNTTKYRQVKHIDGVPRLVIMEVQKDKSEMLPSTRHSNKHLFSNILFCGNCGWAHTRKNKRDGKEPHYFWCCSRNHKYGKTECAFTNRMREIELLELVKNELEDFRSDKKGREWYLDAYIQTKFPQIEDEENVLQQLDSEITKINVNSQALYGLFYDKIITKEEFKEQKDKLQSQLEELESKQNAIRQREQEIQNLKVKFDETMKALETVDINDLSNSELRKIIARIEVYTTPNKPKQEAKQVHIEWKFLGVTSEDDISWKYMDLKHEEWKRNVWYGGMTDEEISEEQEREEMNHEWEQKPEGQQYLKEQDDLRREIYELEQIKANGKR